MSPPSSPSQGPSQDGTRNPTSSWRAYLLVALLTASVTGVASLYWHRPQQQAIVVHPPPTQQATPTPQPPAPIVVFVSGAVQRPAVYTLQVDARVADALEAAGGFTDEADINAVNQAEPLSDGAQVHVPAMDEVVAEPPAGVSGGTRSGGMIMGIAGQVDINSATLEQLLSLPNIGDVKAQAIIDGRPYASIDELEKIDGIGPKTLDKLRDLVVAQ